MHTILQFKMVFISYFRPSTSLVRDGWGTTQSRIEPKVIHGTFDEDAYEEEDQGKT